MNRLVLIATLASSLTTAIAQSTVVVPNGFTATPGTSGNSFPWGLHSTSTAAIRHQQVYDSANFTGQGITGPITITKLRLREVATSTAATGQSYASVLVQMSTAAVDHTAVSVGTAWAGHHGADLKTVFDGNVSVGTSTGTSPNNWVVEVNLSSPFVYDPSSGNDLIIDVDRPVTGPTSASFFLDVVDTIAAQGSRVSSTSATYPAASSANIDHALVMELTYTPTKIVVPDGYATTAGNSQNSFPWGLHSTTVTNIRSQQVYDSSAFTSQSINGPIAITGLRFRERATGTQAGGATYSSVTVQMSTAAVDHISVSTTWASNHGADLRTVFSGTVGPVAASAGTSPNNWIIEVPLDSPFLYDPSSGQDIVIDVDRPIVSGTTFFVDAVSGSTAQGSRVYTSGATYPNASGIGIDSALVCELMIEPFTAPAPAEILNYQFNEVRGTDIANVATSHALPSSGTVNTTGWQTDPGRSLFKGNNAGFGALANSNLVTNTNIVDSGGSLDYVGSMTISWWQRMNNAPSTALAYAFGGSSGWRTFTNGVAGTGLSYRGTPIGDIVTTYDVQANPGVWEHMLLSIDDAAGSATWYANGNPVGTTAFTPGTHATGAVADVHVGYYSSTASTYTSSYDMDDFRIYSRALTAAQAVYIAAAGETAAAGSAGQACDTIAGTPLIGGTGGRPTSGNAGFGVRLTNLEPSQLCGVVLDLFPAGPVINLDPWLTGPGCGLQLNNSGVVLGIASPLGNFGLNLPIATGFDGFHIYAQGLQLGSAGGGATKLLDINIQAN